MNVGYSVSGKTPDDFIWLNGETPVELPMGDWKEYRYTIPAKAKYVTINCVSDYLFLMMVDDIFIGIEETATANVRVMPNPTSGFLKIEGSHETVEIVSATGLTVARFGNEKTIDISPLPDGIYFVKVTAGECA